MTLYHFRSYTELTACKTSCEDQVKDLTSKIVEKDLQIQAALDSGHALKIQLQKQEQEHTK